MQPRMIVELNEREWMKYEIGCQLFMHKTIIFCIISFRASKLYFMDKDIYG